MDNEERARTSVDDDRVEGSMKKMGGNLKEGGGVITGDEKMKREGQADQTEVKLQNAWGSAKEATIASL